jgi:ATP-dependent Clp protease ATP-binding subunit ClpA
MGEDPLTIAPMYLSNLGTMAGVLLEHAQQCARARNQAYLSPAHVLCAMCEDQVRWSEALLGLTGAQCEMVMWELQAEALVPQAPAAMTPAPLPLTSGLKALLQRADRRATQRGDRMVSLRDVGESLRDREGGVAHSAIALALTGEAHPPPKTADD